MAGKGHPDAMKIECHKKAIFTPVPGETVWKIVKVASKRVSEKPSRGSFR
jgi:hypothetical protein